MRRGIETLRALLRTAPSTPTHAHPPRTILADPPALRGWRIVAPRPTRVEPGRAIRELARWAATGDGGWTRVGSERDRADRGLVEATQRAQAAVAGIVADGPVAVVNTERARLAKLIEQAERAAAKWERDAAAFAKLRHSPEARELRGVTARAVLVMLATRVQLGHLTRHQLLGESLHVDAELLQGRRVLLKLEE